MPGPLSVGVPPSASLLRELPDAAQRWSQLGYRGAWASEVSGPDFATVLGAIAGSPSGARLELGIGVAPVQTRPAWLLAATAMSLATIAGTTVHLGLGSSSPLIVDGWSGRDYSQPLLAVRETIGVVRGLLNGARTDVDGRTLRSHGYRLPWTSAEDVIVYQAALGPRALRQAGEIADGVVLNLLRPDHLPGLLQQVMAGRAGSALAGSRPRVAVLAYCWVTDEVDDALAEVRRRFLPYVTTEVYARYFHSLGFGKDVERAVRLVEAGQRTVAAGSLSSDLVSALAVVGPAKYVADYLRDFLDAGTDTLVVTPACADLRSAWHTWETISAII